MIDDHLRRVTDRLLEALDRYLAGEETIEALHGEVATAGTLDNQHRHVKQQVEQLDPSLEEIRFLCPVEQQKEVGRYCGRARPGTSSSLRGNAIIRPLVDTGICRGGLTNLRVEDLDFDQDVAYVIGKGRRPRACPSGPRQPKPWTGTCGNGTATRPAT